MYLCNTTLVYSKRMGVLDLLRVFVHNDLYTRDGGDASSSAHRDGPRSNGTYSLVFTHLNVFFKHGHFEAGATLLSPLKGATLNGSSGIVMQFYPALPMLGALGWIIQLNQQEMAILRRMLQENALLSITRNLRDDTNFWSGLYIVLFFSFFEFAHCSLYGITGL
jgi:hypothetical protein